MAGMLMTRLYLFKLLSLFAYSFCCQAQDVGYYLLIMSMQIGWKMFSPGLHPLRPAFTDSCIETF